MTRIERTLITMLGRGGESFPRELARRSGKRIKPNTAVVTLNRMEAKGLVVSRRRRTAFESGKARRYYRLALPLREYDLRVTR